MSPYDHPQNKGQPEASESQSRETRNDSDTQLSWKPPKERQIPDFDCQLTLSFLDGLGHCTVSIIKDILWTEDGSGLFCQLFSEDKEWHWLRGRGWSELSFLQYRREKGSLFLRHYYLYKTTAEELKAIRESVCQANPLIACAWIRFRDDWPRDLN